MKKIVLYSDGSTLGNPGAGGYCGIIRYKNNEKIIKGKEANTTNNRMELKAVIESLNALKEACEVHIYSDSNYVVKAINEWLENWQKKNFKKVKNVDLWKQYLESSKRHKIHANWVKGHNGDIYNERCDELARQEANSL